MTTRWLCSWLVVLLVAACIVPRASCAVADDAVAPAADWTTLLLCHFDDTPISGDGHGFVAFDVQRPVLGPGRFGQALDAEATAASSFTLPLMAQPSSALTLECWVFLRERGSERLQRIAGRSSNFGMYVSGRGSQLTFFVMGNEWVGAHAELPLRRWVHLAGTYDGQHARLYVDGEMVDEKPVTGDLKRSGGTFFLGSEAGREEHRFLGLIDELRLSKRVRTDFFTGERLPRPEPTVAWEDAEIASSTFSRTVVAVRVSEPPRLDGSLDEPIWQRKAPAAFVDTRTAEPPEIPSSARLAYDGDFLYVGVRCLEKGQESYIAGPDSHDDTALFQGDAVDMFLQPGGASTAYLQFAANPEGGSFDSWWTRPGKATGGDVSGARVFGRVEADVWTLEVALPFAGLGVDVPEAGDEWRLNICRNEIPSRELSALSFSGGGFHVPARFGVLRFAAPGEAATEERRGQCCLRGTVLSEDGKALEGVPVRTVTGIARTDCFGEFVLEGLAPGPVTVQIKSPRYETFAGRVSVEGAEEVAAPVHLRALDPYLPTASVDVPDGIRWLASSLVEPPDLARAADLQTVTETLQLLAAPGEAESQAVAFLCGVDVSDPNARLSGLRPEAQGADEEISGRVRWTQRLLKRVQYKRPREDAVWSWRFLWPESPKGLRRGQVRQLVVTVAVPPDAAPGAYSGTLELLDGDRRMAGLPVRLEVPAVTLDRPAKRVGCYYGIRGTSPEQIRTELADIHAHGGRLLIWHAGIWYNRNEDGSIAYDVSHVREAVELQRAAGIGPPFLVGTNPLRAADLAGIKRRMTPEYAQEVRDSAEFHRIYAEGLRRLAVLEEELGAGEFLYTWMDEVFGRGRFEPWKAFSEVTRALSDNRIYITFHNRNQALVDEAAPYVDVRCYHGHTLDWWLGEGHTWDELRLELERDGDEAWSYYNIREIAVTSEWVRLCNGYWLWKSPLMAHVPWKYYSFGGSAFDDLDSDRHDFAYAAPHPGRNEMVSTLEWECFRDGYDDLRYLVTLENASAEAARLDVAEAARERAEQYVAKWRLEDPRVPEMATRYSASDYEERRRLMAALIEEIQDAIR